ncbi:MAG TPA: LLM class F420-dependent oxidoreductase [Chloroflexota bacterium]|nr:LLM class F420-dependent oxidoreductase [Chloroflexota bacterium]
MRIGVVFPQTEITADPGAVRDYAQAAEDLGYTHLLAYDHVVGADTAQRPDWRGPYTMHSLFHEPLVLFGYLSGLTRRLEFITGILILPQRQTALVAKQAAEVDVLSGGRLRLGVGIGWNAVEYQALGQEFANRGRRSEEQIAVLRALFTQESVTFHGRWHTIEAAGINPLPVQRPIPIWLGGTVEATLDRVGRIGDGWLPQGPPDEAARAAIERIRAVAAAAGRDPSGIGIEARVSIAGGTPEDWRRAVEGWQALGATHLGVNTMNAGLQSPQAHIEAIRRFKDAVAGL